MTFQASENGSPKHFDSVGTGTANDPYIPRRVLGTNPLATDVWGRPIFVAPRMLGHSLFTFGIPAAKFIKRINGTEVLDTSANAFIYSDNGRLKVTSTLGNRYTLQSKRHYRYQPDREHRYSDSAWINAPGAGKLYLVTRTIVGTTVTDTRTEIVAHGLDLSKGNVFDITFQWRGAGDYLAYGNLQNKITVEVLGTSATLTITNPALPAFYEAIQGAHTLGGVARTGSAVRWGLGTAENGAFLEFEYADTANPTLWIGCYSVASQGGADEVLTYSPINTGQINSTSANEPAMAFRVSATRTNDNGNTWVNTVDVILAEISASAVDESVFEVWMTRDATKISNIVGQTWTNDLVTNGAVQYLINNEGGAKTFDFSSTGCVLLMSKVVNLNTQTDFKNPIDRRGDFYLTPGDIIVCTHSTSGTDLVSVHAVFGVEEP